MKIRTNKRWSYDKLTDDNGVEWNVHKVEKCAGQSCALHNPSDHPLKDARLVCRTDLFKYGLVERVCEHEVGHPDPDSVAYYASIGSHGMGLHGCGCRCCSYEGIQNGNS